MVLVESCCFAVRLPEHSWLLGYAVWLVRQLLGIASLPHHMPSCALLSSMLDASEMRACIVFGPIIDVAVLLLLCLTDLPSSGPACEED